MHGPHAGLVPLSGGTQRVWGLLGFYAKLLKTHKDRIKIYQNIKYHFSRIYDNTQVQNHTHFHHDLHQSLHLLGKHRCVDSLVEIGCSAIKAVHAECRVQVRRD